MVFGICRNELQEGLFYDSHDYDNVANMAEHC